MEQHMGTLAMNLDKRSEDVQMTLRRLEVALLQGQFYLCRRILDDAEKEWNRVERKRVNPEDVFLGELPLSSRTIAMFGEKCIFTLKDIILRTRDELLQSTNVGDKSMDAIDDLLEQYGLTYRGFTGACEDGNVQVNRPPSDMGRAKEDGSAD